MKFKQPIKISVSSTNPFHKEDESVLEEVNVAYCTKVILFNDEWHDFEEVSNQILKATNCSRSRAEALVWEVHTKGKSNVYEGDLAECIRVSSVLEEIALHTQIEF